MTHSPLPWTYKTSFNFPMEMEIYACDDIEVCSFNTNRKANAEFIVRACNNHEKLVEALNKIYDSTDNFKIHKIAKQALAEAESEA